jgi:hypothetical protein
MKLVVMATLLPFFFPQIQYNPASQENDSLRPAYPTPLTPPILKPILRSPSLPPLPEQALPNPQTQPPSSLRYFPARGSQNIASPSRFPLSLCPLPLFSAPSFRNSVADLRAGLRLGIAALSGLRLKSVGRSMACMMSWRGRSPSGMLGEGEGKWELWRRGRW